MVVVEQGVAQSVVLIGKFQSGGVKYQPLLHTVPFGEGTGGDVAHDDLQGDDGYLFYQRLPAAQFLHQMGGNALPLQPGHEQVAHPVVDDSLALDSALFQAVEGGGVVLIGNNQKFCVLSRIYLFCLTLIE